jgi:hypothetical protein
MYLGIFNKDTHAFIINSRRIATLVLGLLSGKCHAALIMLGSIVRTIYLCVSRTEVLLMASNTSYHKRLHGSHQFTYHIFASFTTCKCLAVLTHNFGREGSILLCFI